MQDGNTQKSLGPLKNMLAASEAGKREYTKIILGLQNNVGAPEADK